MSGLEWAVAGVAHPGEDESGDQWLVVDDHSRILFGVIDGLGHGAPAAAAAYQAAEVVGRNPAEPLHVLFALCHEALGHTRGVAMTLVAVDVAQQRMEWLGVGSVNAFMVRAAPATPRTVGGAMLRGGIVGHVLPQKLRPSSMAIQTGDVLLVGTDGLAADFAESPDLSAPATQIATDILSRYAKGADDGLALAVRYRGGRG
ncbi:MAG TPA: SpoIIE family protein phosphatase [Jiangellaceae bacterium]